MKNRVISCLLFAILTAAIPLAALRTAEVPVFSPPVGTQSQHSVTSSSRPVGHAVQAPAQPEEDETEGSEPADASVSAAPDEQETEQMQDDDILSVISEPENFLVLNETTGKVMTVSVQDYVRGALAAELPPTFHPEALKAQAVAAHTYALYLTRQRQQTPLKSLNGAQLTADPVNWKSYTTEKEFRKRYGDLADAYWKTICEAADEAAGYLMEYDGEAIAAAYHSMSNGQTEAAENVWSQAVPYLVAVESAGDPLAPDFETEVRFSVKKIRGVLESACPDVSLGSDPAAWLREGGRSESGYLLEVEVGETQTLAGTELRTLLGLRSSDFDVAYDGEEFVFTVRGYGHGVGFSQYGADYLARQGQNFEEILLHYYPGATLARAQTE